MGGNGVYNLCITSGPRGGADLLLEQSLQVFTHTGVNARFSMRTRVHAMTWLFYIFTRQKGHG